MAGDTGFLKTVREFLYGFTAYEHASFAHRSKAELEDLCMVLLVGDLVGVPFPGQHYRLRLLPYLVPRVQGWKRRLLRERDLVEALD